MTTFGVRTLPDENAKESSADLISHFHRLLFPEVSHFASRVLVINERTSDSCQQQPSASIMNLSNAAINQQRTGCCRTLKFMPLSARCSHGCCKIDIHRLIIVGGYDARGKRLSSGAIYDARTEQWMYLPNDMPGGRARCIVVAKGEYVYVIGGWDDNYKLVNTMYRLSLKTYQWTDMAPMSTERGHFSAVLRGGYIYVFGGRWRNGSLASAERYSIADNIWEDLPNMAEKRFGHCAVSTSGNDIYIVGGDGSCSIELFDIASRCWNRERNLSDMPEDRNYAAAVMLRDRYLVVIGGRDKIGPTAASFFIYDCIFNRWSSTSASFNMSTARHNHTAVELGGNVIAAGGLFNKRLSSMESIEARDLLESAPLIYPLPTFYFNRILQIVKANIDNVDIDNNAHAVERRIDFSG